MIDLHTHSNASDGSCTPEELFRLAKKDGLTALSITDHDTINGVKQLLARPLPAKPSFITGAEISCTPPEKFSHLGSIHLLGYGFSIHDPSLNTIFNTAKNSREQRNPKIIEKLNALGFKMTIEQVEERFGANQTGRPHIAELMKELGYVDTFSQAFDKYLGKGKPAYVDKFKISCNDAIKAIINAGGVPVLAHPGLLEFKSTTEPAQFVDTLLDSGLMGMEVYYTDHDENMTRFYERLADEKNLIKTGGSDFHGDFNAGVNLGTGKGNLNVDPECYRQLARKVEAVRSDPSQLDVLQKNLGYLFKDVTLLENALCHRSFYNENLATCRADNERLEFLGDAVVGLCVGHLLMEKFPSKNEGRLSKFRSQLVSEPALADMARMVDLGRHICLGRGETLSRGFEKNSILSDAFEAVVAAIYLDAGFDRAFSLISRLFSTRVDAIYSKNYQAQDPKSMLQEYVQEQGDDTPCYEVIKETGPDHDKMFEVKLSIGDVETKGTGKNKKAAEQQAARNALVHFSDLDTCLP